MQAVVNSNEVVPNMNQSNGEDSYVIRIEMIDGSSQLVHLSIDQAVALGLQSQNIEKPAPKKPASILNYKIIQPADLNLCPREDTSDARKKPNTTSLPRGRPKKRPVDVTTSEVQTQAQTEPKTKEVKTSRTRSGRITRPPVHMERDFEKIVTETKPKLDTELELNTVKFEPIKTSNTDTTEPALLTLESNPRKRLIPAQYRCTTCKKAYMGRSRMARHLKKYPDHGTAGQSAMEDSDAWNCLIETALKANKGQRGAKFCRELMNLLNNARVLVKYFFKPAKSGKEEYVVDRQLADVLRIKDGGYRFNENELCKDINIFSFLFFNDDTFLEPEVSHSNQGFESSTPEKFYSVKEKPVIDLHFGSDITGAIQMPKKDLFQNKNNVSKDDFLRIFNEEFADHKNKKGLYEYHSEDVHVPLPLHNEKSNFKDKEFDLFNSNHFLESKDDKATHSATHDERNGKEVDIFRNTINNILNFGASDEHMSTLLDKEKKSRKSDEFDLNKLHLDELIMPDAPVNNLLDTSTGSDDIMNVDQFVNERFKKLTEPEGDLQSASLNIELPALECFNFHS